VWAAAALYRQCTGTNTSTTFRGFTKYVRNTSQSQFYVELISKSTPLSPTDYSFYDYSNRSLECALCSSEKFLLQYLPIPFKSNFHGHQMPHFRLLLVICFLKGEIHLWRPALLSSLVTETIVLLLTCICRFSLAVNFANLGPWDILSPQSEEILILLRSPTAHYGLGRRLWCRLELLVPFSRC